MSQHDLDIANALFPATRTDINAALLALGTWQQGTSAPATTYADMVWFQRSTGKVWIRNATNTAWEDLETFITLDDASLTGFILPAANGGTGVESIAELSAELGLPAAGLPTPSGDGKVLIVDDGDYVLSSAALGTAAYEDIGTSGATVPVLNGTNTWGATQNFADQILQRPVVQDYAEKRNAIGSIGGGTQDIDLTLGNYVTGTVDTSETTFTFSNPSPTGNLCAFTLKLVNGGSQTVNWPGTVDWGDAGAPDLTASGSDYLVFVTEDAGTSWDGFLVGTGF